MAPTIWKNNGHRPLFAVVIRDGEGNALALVVHAQNDELPGPGLLRDERRIDHHQGDRRVQRFLVDNTIHLNISLLLITDGAGALRFSGAVIYYTIFYGIVNYIAGKIRFFQKFYFLFALFFIKSFAFAIAKEYNDRRSEKVKFSWKAGERACSRFHPVHKECCFMSPFEILLPLALILTLAKLLGLGSQRLGLPPSSAC